MQKVKWQCRWSPTLGELEETHQKIWGTDEYTDQERPTCFFGLYGLPDFYAVWRHKGIKEILWAGTDILHFEKGYWLEDGGTHAFSLVGRHDLAMWLSRNCGHWVENEVERDRLWKCGILARVQPSFLGDVKKFKVNFKAGNKLYSSVSGNNFEQYGWNKVHILASKHPETEFHMYGNTIEPPYSSLPNFIVHGRVSKEKMNNEIKGMQGAIRMTDFDGFSEILAKSILMGQYPVSLIDYPHILKPSELGEIVNKEVPNLAGRNHYLKTLNKFPWNIQS